MKKAVLWIILDLIFLIIFNALFFILGGTDHNTSVWISYVFIHFAYFMLVLTPFLIRKGKSAAIFGFSIYAISSVYFFIELIVGVIFILISSEAINVALLVQLCIAGLYGILLVSHLIANERTADAEQERQPQVAFIKNASASLKGILSLVNDNDARKKVEKVYDIVSSSPVKSSHEVEQIENQILNEINELRDDLSTNSITLHTDNLLAAINERNTRLMKLNSL